MCDLRRHQPLAVICLDIITYQLSQHPGMHFSLLGCIKLPEEDQI